jgi:drug/metabolite transporter (DMT)-like permease
MKRAKLSLLIVAILWGSSFAFQKVLLDTIHPVLFTLYNFLITGILFLLYVLYKKYWLLYRWKEGVMLGLFIAGMEIMQMFGLSLSTAANTSFISNLGMLFIPYLGWMLYQHKVRSRDTLTLLVAAVGLYFLVGGIYGVVFGDFLLLLSSFFMGFYFLMSERFESEKGSHMSVLCVQQFFTVSAVCTVYLLVTGNHFSVDTALVSQFGLQIALFTAIPYALIQWASKYSNEMITAMYDGIAEPLVGGIVAWGLFLEATGPLKVFGAMLMVVSFAASVLYSRKHMLVKKALPASV